MKKSLLVVAITAWLLSGCSWWSKWWGMPLDAARPQVSYVDGKISVKPEPLRFAKDQTNVTIVWALPKGAGLTFADNGIVIDKEQNEIVECRPRNGGLEFTCLNRHTVPGTYKYTIRLQQAGKPLEPLDPTVMND